LERQNSELKSELQTTDGSSRDEEKETNNFMTFYSPAEPSEEGNSLSVPSFSEIRKFMDFNLEALPKPESKLNVSFEPECTGKKEEFVDFDLG